MITRINNNIRNEAEKEFPEEREIEISELLRIDDISGEQFSDDAVSHYFKDTGQVQLLNTADERRLAATMENGHFLVELQSAYREKHGHDGSASDVAYDGLLAIQKGLRLLAHAAESDRLAVESAEMVDPWLNEFVERLSKSRGKPVDYVRKVLINYSVARRIIPDMLLVLLKEHNITLSKLPSENQLKPVIQPLREKLETHFEDIQHKAKKAEEQIVIANLRLVISIARKYIGHGLPLLDLVQEGNTGLMRAVQKFDYHRGYKFSTYATWWIRQSVSRGLADQQHTIRVPVHMVYSIHQYLETRQQLYQENNQKPSSREIAQKMGISLVKVKDIESALSQQMTASLDQPLDDEEDVGELGI